MSTAPLTTAAEEWLYDHFEEVSADDITSLAAFLTTYAAQVRRDTIEECAKIADAVYQEQPQPIHRSTQVVAWRIRALPPGSPSSQTDAGDSNV